MLVAESGFKAKYYRDRVGMLQSIENLANRAGLSVSETIHDHVSEFKNGFSERRRWILGLTTACTEPGGWRHGSWADSGQRGCFRIVRLIRDWDAGRVKPVCKGHPNQWRSRRFPKLQRAARRKGWRRIGCGRGTLHVFWQAK